MMDAKKNILDKHGNQKTDYMLTNKIYGNQNTINQKLTNLRMRIIHKRMLF